MCLVAERGCRNAPQEWQELDAATTPVRRSGSVSQCETKSFGHSLLLRLGIGTEPISVALHEQPSAKHPNGHDPDHANHGLGCPLNDDVLLQPRNVVLSNAVGPGTGEAPRSAFHIAAKLLSPKLCCSPITLLRHVYASIPAFTETTGIGQVEVLCGFTNQFTRLRIGDLIHGIERVSTGSLASMRRPTDLSTSSTMRDTVWQAWSTEAKSCRREEATSICVTSF